VVGVDDLLRGQRDDAHLDAPVGRAAQRRIVLRARADRAQAGDLHLLGRDQGALQQDLGRRLRARDRDRLGVRELRRGLEAVVGEALDHDQLRVALQEAAQRAHVLLQRLRGLGRARRERGGQIELIEKPSVCPRTFERGRPSASRRARHVARDRTHCPRVDLPCSGMKTLEFQMPPRPRKRPTPTSRTSAVSVVEKVIIIRKKVTSSEIMSQ
jgi:hypothetical protein